MCSLSAYNFLESCVWSTFLCQWLLGVCNWCMISFMAMTSLASFACWCAILNCMIVGWKLDLSFVKFHELLHLICRRDFVCKLKCELDCGHHIKLVSLVSGSARGDERFTGSEHLAPSCVTLHVFSGWDCRVCKLYPCLSDLFTCRNMLRLWIFTLIVRWFPTNWWSAIGVKTAAIWRMSHKTLYIIDKWLSVQPSSQYPCAVDSVTFGPLANVVNVNQADKDKIKTRLS